MSANKPGCRRFPISVPRRREAKAAVSSAATKSAHRAYRCAIEVLEQRRLLATVTSASFNYLTAPQNLTHTFDTNVSANLSLDDFVIDHLSNNSTLSRSSQSLSYNTATNVATVTFPGQTGQSGISGMMPDGNFQSILSELGVPGLTEEYVHDWFFLIADADRDRAIGSSDYTIMSANFGGTGKNFGEGDFNLDGSVNLDDFTILGANYGRQVPVPLVGKNACGTSALSSTSCRVEWTAPENGTPDGYRIFRSTDGTNFTQIAQVSSSTQSYDDSGLTHGTKYWYRVRPYTNANGNGATTNKSSAVTVLPTPSSLSVTPRPIGGLSLTWLDNSGTETSFSILRSLAGANSWSSIATVSANVTSFVDTGTAESVAYDYCVRAENSVAVSSYTVPSTAANVSLNAPTDVDPVLVTIGSVRLGWRDTSTLGSVFRVQFSTDPDFEESVKEFVVESPTLETADISELESGVIYYFRVRTEVTGGAVSDFSVPNELLTPIAPPTNIYVYPIEEESPQLRRLQWGDAGTQGSALVIERSTATDFSVDVVTIPLLEGATYHEDIVPDTGEYFYRLKATTSREGVVFNETENGGEQRSSNSSVQRDFISDVAEQGTLEFKPRITVVGQKLFTINAGVPTLSEPLPTTADNLFEPSIQSGALRIKVRSGQAVHFSAVGTSTDPANSFVNIGDNDDLNSPQVSQSRIRWDFEGPGDYASLPGFSAARFYEYVPGGDNVHTVTLTITRANSTTAATNYDPALPMGADNRRFEVEVVPNPAETLSQRVLHVAGSGTFSGTNDGYTEDKPVSWATMVSRINALANNPLTLTSDVPEWMRRGTFVVKFKRGDVIYPTNNASETGELLPINTVVAGQSLSNLRFEAYGSGSAPVIRLPNGSSSYRDPSSNILGGPGSGTVVRTDMDGTGISYVSSEEARLLTVGNNSEFVVVRNLEFQSPRGFDLSTSAGRNAYGRSVTVAQISGRMVTLMNNRIGALNAFVNANSQAGAEGTLLQSNTNFAELTPVPVLGTYFAIVGEPTVSGENIVGPENANWVFLGNKAGDSYVRDHNIRTNGSRVLAFENELTNFFARGAFARENTDPKGVNTLRANNGNFIWWENNTTRGGQLFLGPFTTARPKMFHAVVEGNRMLNYDEPSDETALNATQLAQYYPWPGGNGPNAQHRMFVSFQAPNHLDYTRVTNNYVEATRVGAIQSKGKRTYIAHNTFAVKRGTGAAASPVGVVPQVTSQTVFAQGVLTFSGEASQSQLFNNATVLTTSDAISGGMINFVSGSTSIFDTNFGGGDVRLVGGNVWPASGEFELSSTGSKVGFATWNSNVGGDDASIASTLSLDSKFRVTNSGTPVDVAIPIASGDSLGDYAARDAYGDLRSATSRSAGAANTIPPPPTGLIASVTTNGQVNVTWTNRANPLGILGGYGLFRQLATGGNWTRVATVVAGAIGQSTTATDSTTTAGSSYRYRVSALPNYSAVGGVNDPGSKGFSELPGIVTVSNVTVSAPTGVTAVTRWSSSTNVVDIGWTSDGVGVASFQVERAGSPAFSGSVTTFTGISSSSRSYADTSAAFSQTYYYRVVAVPGAGPSEVSADVAVARTVSNTRLLSLSGGSGNDLIEDRADGILTIVTLNADELSFRNDGAAAAIRAVSVVAGDGADTVRLDEVGTEGVTVNGEGGADSIVAGAFNDSLVGGLGNDTIEGGAGNDLLFGDANNDLLRGGSGSDSLRGGSNGDSLFGGEGNDTCEGDGGFDAITGEGGDDLLRGGTDGDTISGGTGFRDVVDYYALGATTPVNVTFNDASDDGLAPLGVSEADNITNSIEGVQGSDGNDTLNAGFATRTLRVSLYGNGGDDTLTGGGGPDYLQGGAGNDRIFGGGNSDELRGSGGADSLEGGSGDDSLFGGDSSDTLFGVGGADLMNGEGGADIFFAQDGTRDTLNGGVGDGINDTVQTQDSLDELLNLP